MTGAQVGRAAFTTAGGGIAGLTLGEAPVATPGPGEALVRLIAATLNYRDLLAVRGQVPGCKAPAFVPLSDAVGEVAAVGEGVARVAVGDRVNPLFAQGWLDGPRPTMTMLGGPVDGVARQHAVFDAESLVPVPDAIDDLAAAAMPCAGVTAWNALFGRAALPEGARVLVQGTGGVSLMALQLAKAAGASVVVTSSSDARLARAKALGADIGVNYRDRPDWDVAVRDALGGEGVDLVVDVIGEAGLAQSARVLADGGSIAAVGRLSGEASWGKAADRPVVPIVVGNRQQHEALLAFCAGHGIRPVVDAVFDLDRIADAFRLLEAGGAFGKIALRLG